MLRSFAMLAITTARMSSVPARTAQAAVTSRLANHLHWYPTNKASSAWGLGSMRLLVGFASASRGASSPFVRVEAYQYEAAVGVGQGAAIEEVDFDTSIANSVSLIGSVGRTPELKCFENGNKVATMGLAIKASKTAETQWVDVEVWGALAERASAEVAKGQRLAVQGRLRVDGWTDDLGNKRKSFKIVANTIKRVRSMYPGAGPSFDSLDARAQQEQQQQQQQPYQQQSPQAHHWAPSPPAQAYSGSPGGQTAAPVQGSPAEEHWMSFFEDPSGWYDNRPNKSNPKAPDFKRKEGGRDAPALWIDSRGTPAWVKIELQKLDRMNSSDFQPPF